MPMTYRRIVLLAVLAGILLAVPTLWLGFVIDDMMFMAMIEGWYPEMGDPFNLYASFLDLPNTPWWVGAESKICFWRPLPSALLRLNHALFGRWAPGYHLHALLWLGVLIAVCGLLYSRLPRRIAALALAILIFDECHALNSGVICNQHPVITVVPALLGLLAHLRWRERGWRPGLPLSLVGFAVGLLGGETALSIIGYAFAYELFSGRPGADGATARWRQRLVGVLPMLVLAVGYFLAHKAMGYGVSGTIYYVDPMGDPQVFLSSLAGHIPALLASAFVGFPGLLYGIAAVRSWQIVLGVGALLGAAGWLWRSRSDLLESTLGHELRWLIPGALASLIPAALTFPNERQLLAPMLGFAPLLALFLDEAWNRWRRGWSGNAWSRLAAGAFLLIFFVVHFVAPPLKGFGALNAFASMERAFYQIAAQIPPAAPGQLHRQLIVVNFPDFASLARVPIIYDSQREDERIASSWHAFTVAPYAHRLWRTGPRTLELEVVDGQLLTSFEEQVIRFTKESLQPGDVIDGDLFQVEVLRINDRGPTRVAFHFDRDLESPDLVFLVWGDGELREMDPPALGQSIYLKRYPGLIELPFIGSSAETEE